MQVLMVLSMAFNPIALYSISSNPREAIWEFADTTLAMEIHELQAEHTRGAGHSVGQGFCLGRYRNGQQGRPSKSIYTL